MSVVSVCVPHPVHVMCCGNPHGCWESLSWEVCVLWDCVVGWSRQASGDPVGFCLPPLLGLECTADTAHVDCSHSPTNDAYLPTYAMGLGVHGPLMPLYRCAYHSVPSLNFCYAPLAAYPAPSTLITLPQHITTHTHHTCCYSHVCTYVCVSLSVGDRQFLC